MPKLSPKGEKGSGYRHIERKGRRIYKMLKDKRIVLGVTGGIAAYKSCVLTRELIKAGAVAAGACAAVPRGESAGPRRGIGVGLAYMGLGVLLYALLSGQRFEPLAYALDLGMGAAAGGLTGMLRAGMEPKAKSA